MKKILITGAAGFVGRHFTEYFLKKGDNVIAVDNLADLTGCVDPTKNDWYFGSPLDFNNFYFIKSDCRDFFKNNIEDDFDYIYHLAAIVGGREVIEKNPLAVSEDLSIDSQFWSWATKVKPKKIAVFSSSASYPIKFQRQEKYKLLSEDLIDFDKDVGLPDLTYGWSKLTCEYLAKNAYEKYGLKSVVYRPFSGYGSDQDSNYPFTGIIDRAIKNKDKNSFNVWGSGLQMRDFIHIDDCVRGVITTIDKINDSSAINLCTGKLTSFFELAKIVCNEIGYDPKISGTSSKPEGVFARGGSTELQNKLGFYYDIELIDGVKRAVKDHVIGK